MKNLLTSFILMGLIYFAMSVQAQDNRTKKDDRIQQQLRLQQMFINEQTALQNMSLQSQVNQRGSYNHALINDQSVQSNLNFTSINQNGNSNNAQIQLDGKNLRTDALQNGNHNNLDLNIKGSNITSTIVQSGDNNNYVNNFSNYSSGNKNYNVQQQDGAQLYIQENYFNRINGISIKMKGDMKLLLKNGGN
ncbi:hypothetical protein [Prolixibacter sp. SD074]|uniref:hypothetical protein n=1 Tax=Prolixibacter sp. SD074 TaxID=2652391 RepID=UPI001298F7E1|nr:hypothetical protein [Prolixibacter sp. SD074]